MCGAGLPGGFLFKDMSLWAVLGSDYFLFYVNLGCFRL